MTERPRTPLAYARALFRPQDSAEPEPPEPDTDGARDELARFASNLFRPTDD